MREPRPLRRYRKPDVPTLEDLLEDPARRKFLELAGAGAVALAGGGLLVACDDHREDDDSGASADDDYDDWAYSRIPQSEAHEATIGGGDLLVYYVRASATSWSVAIYLDDNEGPALEVLDTVLRAHDCGAFPGSVGAVEADMADALTYLCKNVGGLSGSVHEVSLHVEVCM